MKILACFLLAVLISAATGASSATPVLYDCTITQKRERAGSISDKMAIAVTKEGKVYVSDAIILHFHEQPMQVRVQSNSDKTMKLRWTLKNIVNADNQTKPEFRYSATLTKNTNKISVYAQPENYANRFSGKGTCVLKAAK